jgi:SAM-dependent methyltransferase
MNKSRMNSYRDIYLHYEQCLKLHGDNHKGVDWPDAEGALVRYEVMLDVVRDKFETTTLLDFGCGAAHLKHYIDTKGLVNLQYSGLDISPVFVELCQTKFPNIDFFCQDILESVQGVPKFDYLVMNGVFTVKRNLAFDEMWDFFTRTLVKVFDLAQTGLAFNVMSKHVDWERDDLFHIPFDLVAGFLTKHVSRNFLIRNDYGMYEYTVYVYR